jgi:hypothetical protein
MSDVLERSCRLIISLTYHVNKIRRTGPEMSDLSILPLAFFFVGVDFNGAASFSFFSSFTLTI